MALQYGKQRRFRKYKDAEEKGDIIGAADWDYISCAGKMRARRLWAAETFDKMWFNMADTKEHAYELIDRLPQTQLSAVVGLLEAMLDPVSRGIANAPKDEEELTAEMTAALDHARDWLKHNRGIPHEEILTELGITREEIERFKEVK